MSSPSRQADASPQAHKLIGRLKLVGAAMGLLGIVGAVIGALVDYKAFIETYLFAFVFWLALPLGGLFLLMVHHLVRGRWGAILRRPLEAAALTAPLFLLLFVPIALSPQSLYPWSIPEIVQASEVLRHKDLYLNVPFFLVRAAAFLGIWTLLAFVLRRWSLAQENTKNPGAYREYRTKLRILSALGLVALVLTDSFAMIDWVQSLEPEWYSSIYPMMTIVGQLLTAMTFFCLLVLGLRKTDALSEFVDADRLNDLGNLLLVFVVLWAYTEFVQLVIIWSGNTHHKIPWYLARSAGGWAWVIAAVVALQFFVPLFALFFRKVKRSPKLFIGLCALIFVMRLADVYWLVLPAFYDHEFVLLWQAFANWAAIGGLWLFAFAWLLGRKPLMTRSSKELFPEWRKAHGGR
ncbi:hypothetical protein FIV42_06735 [Persicimonas caeni]|uniref:Quinol:cytochrome C oxidoreductase n=1 Tax=Persicimonas caeni TaxID=2292766 RepID=A0A4Y6PQ43_PERCE|nr:hypothetical protein [Persicimonas caeni]QDG50438.1 hypothetical protein FIV42_06735 [Persicimonas caeni]QED31659.1 hypothetical protein FRD00_06730 [Persicimonas caeni]